MNMLYDEIRKSHKNNNFRPKSIPDFSSDFKFQTNIFSYFRKITAISISHNGSYEKKMIEKKVIGKFWENFLQKRSDLLQKVTY